MNKKLGFTSHLVPLVLSGEKISTWRLWDDKALSEGDMVDFIDDGSGKLFTTARLTRVIEKPMGELTQEDKKGHEKFKDDEEMYQTYSGYYGRPVNPKTSVKIIWFELLLSFPFSAVCQK